MGGLHRFLMPLCVNFPIWHLILYFPLLWNLREGSFEALFWTLNPPWCSIGQCSSRSSGCWCWEHTGRRCCMRLSGHLRGVKHCNIPWYVSIKSVLLICDTSPSTSTNTRDIIECTLIITILGFETKLFWGRGLLCTMLLVLVSL